MLGPLPPVISDVGARLRAIIRPTVFVSTILKLTTVTGEGGSSQRNVQVLGVLNEELSE